MHVYVSQVISIPICLGSCVSDFLPGATPLTTRLVFLCGVGGSNPADYTSLTSTSHTHFNIIVVCIHPSISHSLIPATTPSPPYTPHITLHVWFSTHTLTQITHSFIYSLTFPPFLQYSVFFHVLSGHAPIESKAVSSFCFASGRIYHARAKKINDSFPLFFPWCATGILYVSGVCLPRDMSIVVSFIRAHMHYIMYSFLSIFWCVCAPSCCVVCSACVIVMSWFVVCNTIIIYDISLHHFYFS